MSIVLELIASLCMVYVWSYHGMQFLPLCIAVAVLGIDSGVTDLMTSLPNSSFKFVDQLRMYTDT
jgi:hypothetical protein